MSLGKRTASSVIRALGQEGRVAMEGRRRVDVVGGADCPLLVASALRRMHSDIELMLECSVMVADSRNWSCREVQYCSAVAVRCGETREAAQEE